MSAPYHAKVLNAETINNGAAATVYSTPFAVAKATNWAIHMSWTGTPTSSVSVWATCKPDPSYADDTDWVEATAVSITGPVGAAGKELVEVGNSGAYMYRLKVVTSASSGTFSAWVHAKGF